MNERPNSEGDSDKAPSFSDKHPLNIFTDPREPIADRIYFLSKTLESQEDQYALTLSSVEQLKILGAMVELEIRKRNFHLGEQLLALLGKKSALMQKIVVAKQELEDLQQSKNTSAKVIQGNIRELRVHIAHAMEIWLEIRDEWPLH